MATSQTNNYYLNQWMPNDQVLRREFNEDNYKIDMAMHAIADRLTTVGAGLPVDQQRLYQAESAVGTGILYRRRRAVPNHHSGLSA